MIELISIAILIVIIFIGLFWLKKTLFIFGFFFKVFMLLMLVGIVGSIIFGYMVFKDANDFRSRFSNSTNVFIVKDTHNGSTTFLSGIAININNQSYVPLPNAKLSELEKAYNDDRLSESKGDYYKVFVIDLKAFDDIKTLNISDQNIELDNEQVKQVLLSSNARDTVTSIVAAKNGVSKDAVAKELNFNNEQIKGYILSYYLSSVFDPTNVAQSLSALKGGNIKVYQETALFKAVKLIPQSIVSLIVNF